MLKNKQGTYSRSSKTHAGDIDAMKYYDDPELMQEVLERHKRGREYVRSHDIPPVYEGDPKSQFDLEDGGEEFTRKIRQHDLLKACALGDYKDAKRILRLCGKDLTATIINNPDKDGATPLDHARANENKKLEKLLLRHGATDSEDEKGTAGANRLGE